MCLVGTSFFFVWVGRFFGQKGDRDSRPLGARMSAPLRAGARGSFFGTIVCHRAFCWGFVGRERRVFWPTSNSPTKQPTNIHFSRLLQSNE